VFNRSSDSDKGLEAPRISRRIFQFPTVALAVVSIKLKARGNRGYAVRRENRPPKRAHARSGIVGIAETAGCWFGAEWTNGRECAKGLNCSAAVIGSSRSFDEQ
jgi:hypothetical protein